MADRSTVETFMLLFRGRTDAFGSVEGRSNKEKVTQKHYEDHLQGKVSLGVYPLLDDGTCYFFALDYDEHNTHKVLAIRQAFRSAGLPIYLAASKSKGYHLYGFAEKEPFVAKDIRILCHGILAKLDIQCEVFPKQDTLDEVIPLGNYINLPCFGATRPFLKGDLTEISFDEAAKQIKYIPKNLVASFIKTLPLSLLPAPIMLPPQKKKGRPKKSNNAPCVDAILKGVTQPGRDDAAFALARHYLDQGFTEPEVFQVLQRWDINNKPPLNDPRLLSTKVRSAAKGYAFGCGSIQNNPNLSAFCCGEENCSWLKALTAEKKKKGLIREQSFHETETHLYEQIVQKGTLLFAAYEKATQEVTYTKEIAYPDFTIVPVGGRELSEGIIFFPTEVAPYDDTINLKNKIKEFIAFYVDLDERDMEFCAWYVMGSWVYDRLNTIAYLRFLGDTGVGKSRAVKAIGELCYKALKMSGAVTPAPIYREIRRFRGTLLLDEADFSDTTEKSEVVTILNCGIERGLAVLRCSSEDPNVIEVLPTYGPKVFATRSSFDDKALESRCYTSTMKETIRENFPIMLGTPYRTGAMALRNMLLLWRFHNYERINVDDLETIDLGPIEPRLKQLGLPFIVPFMHLPEVMSDFRNFLLKRQIEITREREESDIGEIVRGIFEVALENDKWVSAGNVARHLTNENHSVSTQKVTKTFGSLAIKRSTHKMSKPGETSRHYYILWDVPTMQNLLKRYFVAPEEFLELFTIDMEV